MKFQFAHNNFNVLDLERSLKFYEEALGFKSARKLEGPGFTLAYLSDGGQTQHELELTWIHGRKEPYNLGENEFHLACARTTSRLLMRSTRRWAASASRMKRWASISSAIRMATGSRSCRRACETSR